MAQINACATSVKSKLNNNENKNEFAALPNFKC